MNIKDHPVEQEITLDDTKDSIITQENDVAPGDSNTPAYVFEGPEAYLVGILAGTSIAPEFRDANGNRLDDSTRVEIVKCDKQGNRLADGVVFSELLGKFNFDKMRNDPEFFRKTSKDLMLNEREIAKVFVHVPSGAANGYDSANSSLTIGDDTSDFGKPVELIDHDDLTEAEKQAIAAASQNGGN